MVTPSPSSLITVIKDILHHLDDKFVRARLNGPRQSLVLLLTIIHSGVNRIGIKPAKLIVASRMDSFLRWGGGAVPSVSAIARAVRKVRPQQLESVIAVGLAGVARTFGAHLFQHGYRLVAIDGVRINTQRTRILARLFGRPHCGPTTRAHQPQALVVMARCVRTGVMLAQELVAHDGNERACAHRLCDRLASCGPIIVLLDRGFPDHALIHQLQQRQIKFIMRMHTGATAWTEVRPALAQKTDGDYAVPMRLRPGDRHTMLRLITTRSRTHKRSRRHQPSQRIAVLTNLTQTSWKAARLIAMYLRRWDIETMFREDKRLLGATKSRARNPDSFHNEIHALHIYRLIMALIHAMAVNQTTMPRWENDHAQRYVTTQLISVAWILIDIIMAKRQTDQQKIALLIREIIRDAPKKRPGRSYQRSCKGREGIWKLKQRQKKR